MATSVGLVSQLVAAQPYQTRGYLSSVNASDSLGSFCQATIKKDFTMCVAVSCIALFLGFFLHNQLLFAIAFESLYFDREIRLSIKFN